MTETMEYPKQSASQNKKRFREFLEKKGFAFDDIEFEHMSDLEPMVGKIVLDSLEPVSFEDLPDDIDSCTVLIRGRRMLRIRIQPRKLTVSCISDPENG